MPLQWFLLTTAKAQKSHELMILNHHNALLNANDPCKAVKERIPIHEQRKMTVSILKRGDEKYLEVLILRMEKKRGH